MRTRLLIVLVSFGVTILPAACNRTSEPTQSNSAVVPTIPEFTGPHAAARKTFAIHCTRCHKVDGEGGPAPLPGGIVKKPKGPDLGKVGQEAGRDVEWFVAYVRDPKSKKPDSGMPPFEPQKLSDSELRAVGEYLTSLK